MGVFGVENVAFLFCSSTVGRWVDGRELCARTAPTQLYQVIGLSAYLGPVVDAVGGGHVGQQRLRRADVARRLLAGVIGVVG